MRKCKWLAKKKKKKKVRFTFLYTQTTIIEGGTVTLNETHQDRNLSS